MLRRTALSATVLALVAGLPPASGSIPAPATRSFANPIFGSNNADPSIRLWNGFYYFTWGDTTNVFVGRSRTLEGVHDPDREVVAYTATLAGQYSNVYAPELERVDGHWYIYASGVTSTAEHRTFAIEALTDDPVGPYGPPVPVVIPGLDVYNIDASVLHMPNRDYLLVSALASGAGSGTNPTGIWIAPLRDATTVAGSAARISTPTLPWEGTVNEAPAAIVHRRTVSVTYSANNFMTTQYAVGLLTAPVSANLLDPASWTKHADPILSSGDSNVWGPGSNAFTTSPDGHETWAVYHAKDRPSYGYHRHINAQRISWAAGGWPVFGAPIDVDVDQARPSGERGFGEQKTYEAEWATRVGGEPVQRLLALGGQTVRLGTSITFRRVDIERRFGAGILVRYATSESTPVVLNVIVNGGTPSPLLLPGTGGFDAQSAVGLTVVLPQGRNVVQLRGSSGPVEIDALLLPQGR